MGNPMDKIRIFIQLEHQVFHADQSPAANKCASHQPEKCNISLEPIFRHVKQQKMLQDRRGCIKISEILRIFHRMAFSDRQACLVRMCDELHETSTISDEAWDQLRQHFDETQVLELIYTVGMYHCVSFLVNGLGLENETFGARFAEFD